MIYHKLEPTDSFVWHFSAYHIIQAWCDQNKPLKRSFNYISGNEFFKYVIDGKVYMKRSVKARERLF